jgi:hypothetical protein
MTAGTTQKFDLPPFQAERGTKRPKLVETSSRPSGISGAIFQVFLCRPGEPVAGCFYSLCGASSLGFTGGLCGDYVTTSRGLLAKFHNGEFWNIFHREI